MTTQPINQTDPKAVQDDENQLQIHKGPPWYRSQRYLLAYILCGGIMNIFFQRNNLNITIVCMVNHTYTDTLSNIHPINTTVLSNKYNISQYSHQNDTSSYLKSLQGISETPNNEVQNWTYRNDMHEENHLNDPKTTVRNSLMKGSWDHVLSIINSTKETNPSNHDECSAISGDVEKEEEDGPLRWDKQTQGIVLGAVYWTYSAFSMPCHAVVGYFSKKRIIAVSMSVMTVLTMLIHVATFWSPWAVVCIKLVQGICTCLAINTIYGFWGTWAPPEERTGLLTVSFAGSIIANAIVFPISGLLCKYGFLQGWPSVFYVFGSIGLLWVIVFILFTSDSPASHRSITIEERNYIERSLPSTYNNNKTKKSSVPWKLALTSVPVWAFIIHHLCYAWAFFLIMTTSPLYMKEVLRFPVDSNGLYTMLPWLLQFVVSNISGQIINFVVQRKLLSLMWVRRITSIIGNILPAILLSLLGFLDCTQSYLAVCLLTLTVGIAGTNLNGFFITPYDIAPEFAQGIMTFSNMLAVANGVVAPYVVMNVTKDKSKSQWQTVFFMTSAIMTAGTLVFCILGQADIQDWAMPNFMKKEIEVTVDDSQASKALIDDDNNVVKIGYGDSEIDKHQIK